MSRVTASQRCSKAQPRRTKIRLHHFKLTESKIEDRAL
jgi:hypothetical protein